LRKELVPNWTSEEFVGFVDKIGWFVDELWKGDSGFEARKRVEVKIERLEDVWRLLLDVEKVFWPAVE
jgi:hypothetical protein